MFRFLTFLSSGDMVNNNGCTDNLYFENRASFTLLHKGGNMTDAASIAEKYVKMLRLRYSPIGCFFADTRPEGAVGFRKKGTGCIMPLILSAGTGKTVAFDRETTGWPCSAFYLGYKDWIFTGVECFLAQGPSPGRECERFVKTAGQARRFLKAMRFETKTKGAVVFKPVEHFAEGETPEFVIFFANADQLSALVFLLYFDAPEESDRVMARFSSACGSVFTLPLQCARKGEAKAVWGLHDISARLRLPKDLMTFAVPFPIFMKMGRDMKDSFLKTETWDGISRRIGPAAGGPS